MKNVFTLNFANKNYLIYFFPLSEKNLTIIPNFNQKDLAQNLVKEKDCVFAINGGFYDQTGKPLGLFIADGEVKSQEIKNDQVLLTGFFYLDQDNQPQISRIRPDKTDNIIQAGPFIDNAFKFKTIADQEARRVLIAQTEEDQLYALAVIQEENPYQGPLLTDLPALLFAIKQPFVIKQALNLDGGSASFYYNAYDNFTLSELTPVGSLICVRGN